MSDTGSEPQPEFLSPELLNDEVELVTFQPGDVIFRENETSYYFIIVQEGKVEIYKTKPDGTKVSLTVVSEGAAIGEFAMVDRRPRSATAQALTEVRAVRVSENGYQQLLDDLPDWAVSVMRSLIERVRQMSEIISQHQGVDAKTKAAIATTEWDQEQGTLVDTNPFLREAAAEGEDPEQL